mmetsp:Transcript_39732/g.94339  ORF Transcript_39732/g.94339 Transcript_39732/m.94339 type:complete len:394 (+) Transcript_39732:356-1537(+)
MHATGQLSRAAGVWHPPGARGSLPAATSARSAHPCPKSDRYVELSTVVPRSTHFCAAGSLAASSTSAAERARGKTCVLPAASPVPLLQTSTSTASGPSGSSGSKGTRPSPPADGKETPQSARPSCQTVRFHRAPSPPELLRSKLMATCRLTLWRPSPSGAWHQKAGDLMQSASAPPTRAQSGAPLSLTTQPPFLGRPGPMIQVASSRVWFPDGSVNSTRSRTPSSTAACGASGEGLVHQARVKPEAPADRSPSKAPEISADESEAPPSQGAAAGAWKYACGVLPSAPAATSRHSSRSSTGVPKLPAPAAPPPDSGVLAAAVAAANDIEPVSRTSPLRSSDEDPTSSCVSRWAVSCKLWPPSMGCGEGRLSPIASSATGWPTSSNSWNRISVIG